MSPPAATRTHVRNRLLDLGDVNPLLEDGATLDEAITAALSRYSLDRPRQLVADVNGSGSPFYPLTGASKVLTSWLDGLSSILAIDYPAGTVSASYQPTYLNQTFDWRLYADSTVTYLRLLTVTPKTGEKLRITYTAPHLHDSTGSSVPVSDLDALYDLSASYACLALATKMAASSDSVITADSTNYRDGQLRFKQQADAWEASYQDRLGIKDGVAAGSAVSDWVRTAPPGVPFLTHNRRWGAR